MAAMPDASASPAVWEPFTEEQRTVEMPQVHPTPGPVEPSPAQQVGDLTGRVLALSMDVRGCRLVQDVLERSGNDVQLQIAKELQGNVAMAVESPHANHVLQRMIELMRPAHVAFVLEELLALARPVDVARHRYGCRVLERLIEHFPPDMLDHMLSEIVKDSVALSRHPFGNFVMQHVLEHAEPKHRELVVGAVYRELADTATDHLQSPALDAHASNVLDKALSYTSVPDQRRLAVALLAQPGLLVKMACSRHGSSATQRLLMVVDGRLLAEAQSQLTGGSRVIESTKNGKWFLKDFNFKDSSECGQYPGAFGKRASAGRRQRGKGRHPDCRAAA